MGRERAPLRCEDRGDDRRGLGPGGRPDQLARVTPLRMEFEVESREKK